ncbi:hypothetical protein PENTCL1PPCAC_2900, partial [Pristionchus entomophagus]
RRSLQCMQANNTTICWTDWSPCTVSCVPQDAAFFARKWRRQIPCDHLGDTLVSQLAVIGNTSFVEENVTATFKPCDYKLPICQLPPAFPSVHFNNLVYMRILVLSLSSLFVLIPTLIVCIKYRRHAHPFVWLHKQDAASLRDPTERSENQNSAKINLKTDASAGLNTIPKGLVTPTQTTTTTTKSAESKKQEKNGRTGKRNTEWSKIGKSITAPVEEPPKVMTPLVGESVSAHEFFTTVNIEPEQPKNVIATTTNNVNVNTTTSVDTRDEKTQDSKTNEGSVDETTTLVRRTKSVDNNQEMKSVTQEKTPQDDVAPQLEGALVKGDVGARMEDKTMKKEEERVEETQERSPSPLTPR